MQDNFEKLGQLIDQLDNYIAALTLPLPDAMHIEQLKKGLPEISQEMKEVFENITGENPWE